MVIKTFSSVAVVVALGLLTPIHANAFGLGKLELSSALNEPFKAKIPVTALREDEEGNLQVRLATSNEFARAGLERSHYLTQLVFTVIEKPGGATIEVSSTQPIREPFVDFLLTATTGEGRLIREYTVLLDPPKTMFVKPAKVIEQPKAKPTSQQTSNKTTYQYPDSGYQAPTTNYYSGNSYGPTKRDDTLWDIALETKPSSASVHQMMMALLDANPSAFIKNNINNLKTGQTLTIPSVDEITRLSNRQAVARVAEHWQQWKNANNMVATQNETQLAASDSEQLSQDSESSNAVGDEARLQLVVDNDDSSLGNDELSPLGSDSLTKLRDQLTLAQETIEGQEQENIDFKARMDAMEEQLEIMRRIIAVKDSDLARLQGILGDDEQVALESDELTDEMQEVLEDTQSEDSMADELVADADELLEEADAGIDALVEDAENMLDTDIDEVAEEAEELLENASTSMGEFVLAERMVDEAAVAAAAEAAKAEAEFSDSNVFVGADAANEIELNVNMPEVPNVDTSVNDDFLQEFRVLDESAVAAASAAAKSEAGYRANGVFSEVDVEMPMDEMAIDTDELEAENLLPYPEVGSETATIPNKIQSFISENKTAVLGGLGALLLGLIAWMFSRRRNQEEYEWVDTDSLDDTDSGEVEVSEETVVTEPEIVIDEDVSSADDLSIPLTDDEPKESIDDLLNQAEMSMAYGEYEQAQETVEKARIQEPNNQAVALKLVALAYHQKQAAEFSRLVADVDLDKDSAEWQEIATWGRELVPENELFAGEVLADLDITAELADTLESTENDVVLDTIETSEENSSDSLMEFSLEDESSLEEKVEDAVETDETLSFDTDFDLETTSNDDALEFDIPLVLDVAEEDDAEQVLDIDLPGEELVLETAEITEASDLSNELESMVLEEIEESKDEELPQLVTETTTEDEIIELDTDADDLDFDIGDFDEVDEAETKLDLASAYVDMGDPDGAKNILNEVLEEGNDDQKSRAQDLLNSLA